ncbi:MAG: hypothetical protein ABI592_06605 [Acidobacteriota bacterium]
MNGFSKWVFRGAVFAALLCAAGCDDPNCPPNSPCPTVTPNPNVCAKVNGTRNVFWSDSCGRSGSGSLVLAQSVCHVTGSLPGLGDFEGNLRGSTYSFTLTFKDPCAGTATGTATMPTGTNVFTGNYSGTQTGSGCCSPVNGSFSFDVFPTQPPTTVTPGPSVTAGPSATPVTVTPGLPLTPTVTP